MHRVNAGIRHFRSLRASWIIEREEGLYEFVKQHVARHRVLPSEETLRRAGHALDRRETGEEPPDFYLDRIKQRAAFNAVNDLNEEYRVAMDRRDMTEVARILRRMAAACGEPLSQESYTTLADVLPAVAEDYQDAKANPGLRGATLAWPTLNALTLGLQSEDLMLIVGRPGDGKTQALLEIGYAQAIAGLTVLLVSMEMGTLQTVRRLVARHAALNPNWIRGGELSFMGEARLAAAMEDMQEMGQRFFILQGDFKKDVVGVEALVLELQPDVLLIDGAYLLTEEGRASGHVKRWETISGVSNALKRDICMKGTPTIATFQFNRNVRRSTNRTREGEDGERVPRDEREPDLNDIGGSDSAPQDASLVLSMRRGLAPHATTRRRLNLLKNREGEEGEFTIHFEHSPPRFDEVIETEEDRVSADWML